jgi:cysteine synthase
MTICHATSVDKKKLGIAVGSELVRTHGKKRYYSRRQVKTAAEQTGYSVDWHCWAYSLYISPGDFDAHHRASGETCDYEAMRAEMTAAVTDGASSSWFDVDLSWLEWPDIDFDSLFDFFD